MPSESSAPRATSSKPLHKFSRHTRHSDVRSLSVQAIIQNQTAREGQSGADARNAIPARATVVATIATRARVGGLRFMIRVLTRVRVAVPGAPGDAGRE